MSKLGKYKKKKQKNSKKFKNKKSFKKSSWYPLKSVLFCKMLEIKTFAPFQLLMAKTSTSFSWEKWSFFLWFFFPLMFYANHFLLVVLFSFDEVNDPLWMILCFFFYLFIWVGLICGLQVMCLIKWFYFTFRLLYFCPLCVHSFN